MSPVPTTTGTNTSRMSVSDEYAKYSSVPRTSATTNRHSDITKHPHVNLFLLTTTAIAEIIRRTRTIAEVLTLPIL